MTNEYIDAHFFDIKGHGSDIENRLDDSGLSSDWIKEENRRYIEGFQKAGERIVSIEENFEKTIDVVLEDKDNGA